MALSTAPAIIDESLMILHRFCSKEEYIAFITGKTLVNNTHHSETQASSAVGFCFFTEEPEEAKHWLSGIVDFDWCLTFEVPRSKVVKCVGRYPKWVNGVNTGAVKRREYCTTHYNSETFKLVDATSKYREYAPNASVLHELFPTIFHSSKPKNL